MPAQTTITQLLDRSRARSEATWRARVRITLEDTQTGFRVIGATVTGEFEGYGTRQCVTNNRGRCNVSWYVPDAEESVTYRVTDDGTAGGVVAALTAQGMDGLPVSGQDGDHAALNRVALGTQTVSVWKDAREQAAARSDAPEAQAASPGGSG